MTKTPLFSSLLLFASCALGLEVAVNSPCAKRCLDDPAKGDPGNKDDSLTFHPDLSCMDWEYRGNNATDVGRKFSDCQACMQSSGYEDAGSGERDSGWYLFNNRAAVDWCLFGRFAEENNTDVSTTYPYKQCNSKCQAIYTSSDYRIKSSPTKYDYCDTSGNFTSDADSCMSCLYESQGLTILGNILTTVKQMCVTKPGKSVGIDANIYSASQIKLETATTGSPSASPTSSPSTSSTSSSNSGISGGAIAGIVLGALIGIALILCGVLFFLRRMQNKRKTIDMPKSEEVLMPNSQYTYDPVPQQQKDAYVYGAPMGAAAQPYDPAATSYAAGVPPYSAAVAYGPGAPATAPEPIELGNQTPVNELGASSPTRVRSEIGPSSPTARPELGPSSPTGRR